MSAEILTKETLQKIETAVMLQRVAPKIDWSDYVQDAEQSIISDRKNANERQNI